MHAAAVIVAAMNAREKTRLYLELGQLIRSGTPLRKALSLLQPHTRGDSRAAITAVQSALEGGATVAEAFAAGAPFVAQLEIGILAASDRAGRLESGLAHAAEYYSALAEARSRMWSRAAYPLFVLHVGFIALSLPQLFLPGGGLETFLRSAALAIGGLWATILVGGVIIRSLAESAARSAPLDAFLRSLPVFGKLRQSFGLSRFCSAYNLQLDAGVNALASLETAGRASGSAVIRNAADSAMPALRRGEQVGASLIATGAFPESFVRAFAVGEETGRLDDELRRLADEYRTDALRRLEAISEWVPKLVYFAILIFLAFKIVSFYLGYIRQTQEILKD